MIFVVHSFDCWVLETTIKNQKSIGTVFFGVKVKWPYINVQMLAWLWNLLKGIFNKSGVGNFIVRVVPVHYRTESSQSGAPLKVAAWRCSHPRCCCCRLRSFIYGISDWWIRTRNFYFWFQTRRNIKQRVIFLEREFIRGRQLILNSWKSQVFLKFFSVVFRFLFPESNWKPARVWRFRLIFDSFSRL
jgi:hypothetical protein